MPAHSSQLRNECAHGTGLVVISDNYVRNAEELRYGLRLLFDTIIKNSSQCTLADRVRPMSPSPRVPARQGVHSNLGPRFRSLVWAHQFGPASPRPLLRIQRPYVIIQSLRAFRRAYRRYRI